MGSSDERVQRVELIETTWHEPADSTGPSRLAPVLLAMAVVAGGAAAISVLGSAGEDPPEQSEPAPIPTRPLETEPVLERSAAQMFPAPPRDFDPHVSGRPGAGAPVLGVDSDLTLVYVNAQLRPTVVDFDTGDVRELEIAPGRSYDQFHVEGGRVVTIDSQRHNLDPAGPEAIVVHVHRPSVDPGAAIRLDPQRRSLAAGLHLCLDPDGCHEVRWSATRLTDGRVTIEILRADSDSELSTALMIHTWEPNGRKVVGPEGPLEGFEVPAPLAGAPIWLIHQPEGSSLGT